MRRPRRSALAAVLALAAAAAPAAELVLEPLVRDLELAVGVVNAGDERLFVLSKAGRVSIVRPDGSVDPEPFLDVADRLHPAAADWRTERGLLGLAFHPDHAENGLVYAFFTATNGDSVVARYRVGPADPDRADPASEEVLLRIPQPGIQHKAGQLQFGPDGMLYVATGDGRYSPTEPLCTAQERDGLLGKVLRLDVGVDEPPFYRVPPDNPFAGDPTARGEVFLYGLRNPWRFSFDPATGDLFVADVGQDLREEVNVLPGGSRGGRNYGWKVMEGTVCHGDATGCATPPPSCGDARYTPPDLEYAHGPGRCSVIGGYVYRGSKAPTLRGAYVFGDLCGVLFVAHETARGWKAFEVAPEIPYVTSWGEDADGELLLLAAATLYRVAGTDVRDPRRGALRLAPTQEQAREGEWATVVVERQGGAEGAVGVAYATADGTARAGVDYVPASGTLAWASGDATPRSFVVRLLADDAVEGTETVRVALTTTTGDASLGVPSEATLQVVDDEAPAGPCVADATTLCLRGGRFRVTAGWRDAERAGAGGTLPLTGDTGAFWFFSPANVELLVKVLDGCGQPEPRWWVFAAGLTHVEVDLRVVDTTTGRLVRHLHPAGAPFAPYQNTDAFPCP